MVTKIEKATITLNTSLLIHQHIDFIFDGANYVHAVENKSEKVVCEIWRTEIPDLSCHRFLILSPTYARSIVLFCSTPVQYTIQDRVRHN